MLLLAAVPAEVNQRVLEDVGASFELTAVGVLDEVWKFVAPGGKEEMEGRTKYIRDPGSAPTAQEAIKKLRIWLQSRKERSGDADTGSEPFRTGEGPGRVDKERGKEASRLLPPSQPSALCT